MKCVRMNWATSFVSMMNRAGQETGLVKKESPSAPPALGRGRGGVTLIPFVGRHD